MHHHRTLGIVLLYGPRRGVFLMSEAPCRTSPPQGHTLCPWGDPARYPCKILGGAGLEFRRGAGASSRRMAPMPDEWLQCRDGWREAGMDA